MPVKKEISAFAQPPTGWENVVVNYTGDVDYQIQLRQVSTKPSEPVVFTAIKIVNGVKHETFDEQFQLQVNGQTAPKAPYSGKDYVIYRTTSEYDFTTIREIGIKFDRNITPLVQFNVALLNRGTTRSPINVNPIVRANNHHWTWVPIPDSARHDMRYAPLDFGFGNQ